MLRMSLAAGAGMQGVSGRTWLALTPLLVLTVGLVIFCVVDIIRSPSVRGLPKPLWLLIVVCGSAPLGALAYLVWGRTHDDRHVPGLDPDENLSPDDERRDAGEEHHGLAQHRD